MKYLSIKLFVLLSLYASWCVSEPMILGVPQLKPFTYLEDGKIHGTMIQPVQKALDATGMAYSFKFLATYSQLLKAIRNKEIDGFFVATKNPERDRYGQFSKPIIMDRYTWFLLNDANYEFGSNDFIYKAKIGAVENTNSFRLATRRGYQVFGQPSSVLAHNFVEKNIDAVFATHAPFKFQLDLLNTPPNTYRVITDSIRPFGIYISKKFTAKHPNFMSVLNESITTEKL